MFTYSFLRLLNWRIIIFCCTDRYKTASSTFRAGPLATGPCSTHSTTRRRLLQSEIEVRFARIMNRATIPCATRELFFHTSFRVSRFDRTKRTKGTRLSQSIFLISLFLYCWISLFLYFFTHFTFSHRQGSIVLWEKFEVFDREAPSNSPPNRNWSADSPSLPPLLLSSLTMPEFKF